MRRAVSLTTLGALIAAWPLACGSVNEGEVVIVDEVGGVGNTGGANAGKGGGTPGGASGRGGNSGKGGGAGDAGEAGTGTGATGGSAGNGGHGGTGASGGSSSGGDPGTGGSAGETPTGCTEITDCAGTKPICDDSACRACEPPVGGLPDECKAHASTPHCDSGRCVECLGNEDCSSGRSVCDSGKCRGCVESSECDSGACNSGRCADASSVVYALAGTGSYDSDCGTFTKPCIRLSDATLQLSALKPFLVLIKTTLEFSEPLTLPPGLDVTVVGNHVPIRTYQSSAVTVSGGSVFLDDVVVEASAGPTFSGNLYTVSATAATVKIRKGTYTNLYDDYSAVTLELVDSSAEIVEAEFAGSYQAVSSTASPGMPLQSLKIEKSRFERNRQAINFDGDYFVLRNNLFISNGQVSYVRIIRLIAQSPSTFAFNTLYGNDNNCSYEGGLIACEGGAAKCGTHTSNIFWKNMFGGSGSSGACPDQVYANGPSMNYTIAETVWPGIGNTSDDPLLVDPTKDDFTPGAGSPALDKGESDPAFMPSEDHFGNPRPVGPDPDIGAVEVQ